MSTNYGNNKIVTDGLVVYVDFANPRSYVSASLTGSNLVDRTLALLSWAAAPLFSTGGLGSARFSRTSDPNLRVGSFDNPQEFTVGCWFYATQSNSNGKMIGFDNGGQYDRHIYMDTSGSVVFGVYTGTVITISSSVSYNDSKWHYAAATYTSQSTSMSLYIDGQFITGRGGVNAAQVYTAPWRIGGGAFGGWPTISNPTFQGYIGNATAYHRVLSSQEIQQNFDAHRGRFGV